MLLRRCLPSYSDWRPQGAGRNVLFAAAAASTPPPACIRLRAYACIASALEGGAAVAETADKRRHGCQVIH